MATPTFASVTDALKEDYKDEVEQLPDSTMMLAQLEKNSDSVVGRRARHVIHTNRTSGVGARSIAGGDVLPDAGRQGWKAVNIPVRANYVRVQFPRSLIKAMASDRGAFVRGISTEMDLGLKDSRKDLNRQVWGTSDGVLATCGTTTGANIVVLAAATTPTQVRQIYFEGGGKVDIGTVGSPTSIATQRNVTDYDDTASPPTITIDGAVVTTSASHRVYHAGSGGATTNTGDVGDGQVELTGLQTIVGTGQVHTVDPATYKVFKSKVYSNSGTLRPYSEQLLNRAIHRAQSDSDELVNLLVSNFYVHEAIAADMRAQRRNVDTVALKGGYSGIRWNTAGMMGTNGGQGQSVETALVWENDCPQNKIYGISTKSITLYQMGDAEWADDDGSTMNRVPNQDEYEAYLAWYAELGVKRRNSMFVISDVTEPA